MNGRGRGRINHYKSKSSSNESGGPLVNYVMYESVNNKRIGTSYYAAGGTLTGYDMPEYDQDGVLIKMPFMMQMTR